MKAYVKRNKNDAADAEAICEAVTRPTMRIVPIKSADAQSVLMLHRARHLQVRQRTAQVSAMRAHLAEYWVVAPKGRTRARELVEALTSGAAPIPDLACQTLLLIAGMIDAQSQQIRTSEIELLAWHRPNATCRRLETIPRYRFHYRHGTYRDRSRRKGLPLSRSSAGIQRPLGTLPHAFGNLFRSVAAPSADFNRSSQQRNWRLRAWQVEDIGTLRPREAKFTQAARLQPFPRPAPGANMLRP